MAAIGSTNIRMEVISNGIGLVLENTESLSVNIVKATILSIAVTTGKKWRIQYAEVLCRGYGRWEILADGVRIGGGLTDPSHCHDRTELPDFYDVDSEKTIEVLYLYSHGPNAMPVDVFIGILEF